MNVHVELKNRGARDILIASVDGLKGFPDAIESINATLRKATRKRGALPSPDSVKKVLYLAIMKASEQWARPVRDWVAALNHFTMVFEGRVTNR